MSIASDIAKIKEALASLTPAPEPEGPLNFCRPVPIEGLCKGVSRDEKDTLASAR